MASSQPGASPRPDPSLLFRIAFNSVRQTPVRLMNALLKELSYGKTKRTCWHYRSQAGRQSFSRTALGRLLLGLPRHRPGKSLRRPQRISTRIYDMVLSYGSDPFTQFKQDYTRYRFFSATRSITARDAIYGLERPLMTARRLLQIRSTGIWHRTPNSFAPWPRRLIKIDDGPPAQERAWRITPRPTPANAYTYSWQLPRHETRIG